MESTAEITVLQYLERLDQDATLALNSLSSPVSDFIWQMFSNVRIWFVLYLAVVVILFRNLGWKKALVCVAALILTELACDQFANLVKDGVGRLRPCWDEYMVSNGLHILEKRGGQFGFFSAHAANAAGFALCSASCFRIDAGRDYTLYGRLIAVWAFLIGISRVFVGKHFLGDVLTGFIVGVVFAWLIAAAARAVISRIDR